MREHEAEPLTEDSKISVGLCLALLAAMAAGVTWGFRLEARVDVVSALRGEDQEQAKLYIDTVQAINTRLSRIEGRLGIDDSKQKGR